jgi:ribosomal protein S18 acetylase RimI-like enzyme
VLPAYQAQGLGRQLLRDVMGRAGAAHITLSTPDLETPARKLYRAEGFVDLLRDFYFPGSTEAYAVMGVDL